MASLSTMSRFWPLAILVAGIVHGGEFAEDPLPDPTTQEVVVSDWKAWQELPFSDHACLNSARLATFQHGWKVPSIRLELDAEFNDREILALFEQAMADVWVIRLPQKWCMTGPVTKISTLTCAGERGDLNVAIYDWMFGVHAPPGGRGHKVLHFRSMSLAILLDALLKTEKGVEVPEKVMRDWSGQTYVEQEVGNILAKLSAGVPALEVGKVINRAGGDLPLRDDNLGDEWDLWELLDPELPANPMSARVILGEGDKRELDAVVDDPKVMDLLTRSMWDMITSPPRATDKPCESRPIGQIDLTLPNGFVRIEIHPKFFRLVTVPDELLGPSKVFAFQSPSLAYLIDAIRASAGVARFSDEQREALSGEAHIKDRRAAMLDLIDKTPSLRRESDASKPASDSKEPDAATESDSRTQ